MTRHCTSVVMNVSSKAVSTPRRSMTSTRLQKQFHRDYMQRVQSSLWLYFDFRVTISVSSPSTKILDTIHQCQVYQNTHQDTSLQRIPEKSMCKPPVSEVRRNKSVASPCGKVDLGLNCTPSQSHPQVEEYYSSCAVDPLRIVAQQVRFGETWNFDWILAAMAIPSMTCSF